MVGLPHEVHEDMRLGIHVYVCELLVVGVVHDVASEEAFCCLTGHILGACWSKKDVV